MNNIFINSKFYFNILLIFLISLLAFNLYDLKFDSLIEHDEIAYLSAINLGFFNNYFDIYSLNIFEYIDLIKANLSNNYQNLDFSIVI